jgi:bacterioferritin-associated ferredoxin
MYVCICHGVTENEVRAEIVTGATTEQEIGERCGAGTGCGSCVDKIGALLGSCGRGAGKIGAQAVV